MTVNRGLFVPINTTGNVGTTELEARLALGGLFVEKSAGWVFSGLMLEGAAAVYGTTSMNYLLYPCTAVIGRAADDGAYVFRCSGVTTIPTTAAPGTGSRWDLVWVKQNDKSKGDADNLAVAGVTNGTPGTSPSKPTGSVPAGALVVAEVLVAAGVTQSQNAAITQVYPHAALKGTPVGARDATDMIQPQVSSDPGRPSQSRRYDLPGLPVYEWQSGFAWQLPPQDGGIVYLEKVTSSSGGVSALTVVNAIQNVEFKKGRNYRITWFGSYYQGTASDYHSLRIQLASTADAEAATTGLTQIGGATVTSDANASSESFRVEAIYTPSADETKWVKFTAQSAVGSGNIVLSGSASEPQTYYVEDCGRLV